MRIKKLEYYFAIFILLNLILFTILTSNSSKIQNINCDDEPFILIVDDFNDFLLYEDDEDIFSLKILEYIQFQYLGSEIELGDAIETYELLSDDYFSFFNISLKINLHSLTEYWGSLELQLKQVIVSDGKRLVDRSICSCQIGDLSEENLGYYIANCRFNSTYYCSLKIEEQLSSEEVIYFFLAQSEGRIQSIILANNYVVISESWEIEEIKSVNCIQISVITGSNECNFNTFVYDISGYFSKIDLSNTSPIENTLDNPSFSIFSIMVVLVVIFSIYKIKRDKL